MAVQARGRVGRERGREGTGHYGHNQEIISLRVAHTRQHGTTVFEFSVAAICHKKKESHILKALFFSLRIDGKLPLRSEILYGLIPIMPTHSQHTGAPLQYQHVLSCLRAPFQSQYRKGIRSCQGMRP